MKAMILAAGLGERMRPLTDHTPKPLLQVGGKPLIEHHLRKLAQTGIQDVVINVSHLAQQVMDFCGNGRRWGLRISYSPEDTPLETAGGIQRALPLLGESPFMVVNGDVWVDYPFAQLAGVELATGTHAHLVLVDNPPHHPLGDFHLGSDGLLALRGPEEPGYTYAGLGIYAPAFFTGLAPGKTPLRPLLDQAIPARQVSGEYHAGDWEDVGTPARLAALDKRVQAALSSPAS